MSAKKTKITHSHPTCKEGKMAAKVQQRKLDELVRFLTVLENSNNPLSKKKVHCANRLPNPQD
jgi:hypothetical protein